MANLLEFAPEELKNSALKVKWYKAHKLYGICYKSILNIGGSLTYLFRDTNLNLEDLINIIYEKSIDYSNMVISSELPEAKIHDIIIMVYNNWVTKNNEDIELPDETYKKEGCQGHLAALILMMVLIFVFESYKDESQEVIESLSECRNHIFHMSKERWYFDNKKDIMEEVAKRIPSIEYREARSDYEYLVNELNREIEKLKTNQNQNNNKCDYDNSEQVTLEFGYGKNLKVKHTSARIIAEAFKDIKYHKWISKKDLMEALACITGLSSSSFNKYL